MSFSQAISSPASTSPVSYAPLGHYASVWAGLATSLGLPKEPRWEVRPSGMPYCPLLSMIKYATEVLEGTTEAYPSSFYFKIGTAVHEALQSHLPLVNARAIGRWRCACSYEFVGPALGGATPCPSCGQVGGLTYNEVRLTHKHPNINHEVGGAIDYITLDDANRLYIWDFKTTDQETIDSPRYLPRSKNVAQIQTYCGLMYKVWGVVPAAWGIIYLSRDRPTVRGAGQKLMEPHIVSSLVTESDAQAWFKRWELALDGYAAMTMAVNHYRNTWDVSALQWAAGFRPCHDALTHAINMPDTKCEYFSSCCVAKTAEAPINVITNLLSRSTPDGNETLSPPQPRLEHSHANK